MKELKEKSPGQTCEEQFEIVDIQFVDVNDPMSAIKTFSFDKPDTIVKCDVFIAGGGLGGIACAHTLTRKIYDEFNGNNTNKRKVKVCLIEETNWLGGQATSQGVSALDENQWVESCGASKEYLKFRKTIREYYLSRYSTRNGVNADLFNPGNCWVSRLAFEPKVGLVAIDSMLNPGIQSEKLRIFHRTKAFKVVAERLKNGRIKVKSVFTVNLDSGEVTEFRPKVCIDSTELGDLLPLSGLDYNYGPESKEETGEPHAPEDANCENVQDFVYPFVVEYCPGQDHTISKPANFEEINNNGQFSFLGYKMFSSVEKNDNGSSKELLPFWTYRRLIDKDIFQDLAYANDIAMINWESNDVRGANIIDKSPEVVAKNIAFAKSISLGFLYWLQTEAPRDDGKKGYGELKLREDILQTDDGLSKYPYIRESRRIKTKSLIVETDIGAQYNSGARARAFQDSLGIGHYPIDIHGVKEEGASQETKPFQVPIRALIAEDSENLLPACKNIGVSHLANGSYRLHPVEWAIGTAVGAIAREAVEQSEKAYKYIQDNSSLLTIQRKLLSLGEPIFWFDDVPVDHEQFEAIQMLSITEVMPPETDTLHFYPDKPVSRQMVAKIVTLILDKTKTSTSLIADVADNHPFASFVNQALHLNLMQLDQNFRFRPGQPLLVEDLKAMSNSRYLKIPHRMQLHVDALVNSDLSARDPITRAQFAEWIYYVITYKKKWKDILRNQQAVPAAPASMN